MPRDYKSPVIFTGENPGLGLFRAGTDTLVAAASYWRCTYSEHGEGNALYLWVDLDGAGVGQGQLAAIYADNAAMARFINERFNQHFANFQNKGFASVAPEPARFFQESDSRRYHRVVCHTADRQIELVWSDVRAYDQVIGSDVAYGGRSFELATVICPCAIGSISINGSAVKGDVRLTEREGRQASSAFLAFAESWVDNGPAKS
jgi:hypothetical protein